jgi:hypothetical protein
MSCQPAKNTSCAFFAKLMRGSKNHVASAAARAEIKRWSGRQFDPRIVDVLSNVPDEDWKRASAGLQGPDPDCIPMGDSCCP